jgi:SAM-dependent methyltransferase
MIGATTAARPRRRRSGYFRTIFVGRGIDIGCGIDPVTRDCDTWELLHDQGNAELMLEIPDGTYDWVYSSHLLEHLENPFRALREWWRILRPGGKLILVVPDEDLYEQGHWPSQFNAGHRWTFTIHKSRSWSPVSLNVTELVAALPDALPLWITLFDTHYIHNHWVWDRTLYCEAEAHIEAVVLKGSS